MNWDRLVVTYAGWVIRQRWSIIVAVLVATVVAASGARYLEFSTDYRVMFSDQNPYLKAYTASQNIYTKDDNILLVIVPRDGDVFTPSVLAAVRDLTEGAWKTPFATRVDSLTNFQNSTAQGDDIDVRRLVPKSGSVTRALAADVRRVSLGEPLLAGRLVSKDGASTAVNISLTLPQKKMDETLRAMEYARELVAVFRDSHPGLTVATTGIIPLNHAFVESSISDLSSLIPLMYLVIIVGVAVVLRSLAGTMVTVTMIALSSATAMGLAGWLGYLVNPASAVAPMVITTIAVADSIHILVTVLRERRNGATSSAAIVEGLRINFQPVFLTSLTTLIGFLSLNASDAPPFRDLGNISAIGVAAAWVFSVLLLPAMLAVLPLPAKGRTGGRAPFAERIAEFVIPRRRVLLWGMAAVSIALAFGIPRIELNDQFVNYFSPRLAFRTDTDFAMKRLPGIYQMEFSVEAGSSGAIAEPAYLKRLDAFAEWLRAQPGVAHVQSLAEIMKRLNRNMHGDDSDLYRLPENRKLAAQYLLLFEMSLPYGLDLKNQINLDRSATRVVASLKNITTREARRLKLDSEAWLTANTSGGKTAQATGPLVMFTYISERNIKSMLSGTGLALVLISLCLIVALRDLKLGLISLIPNATPAILAFGIWGFVVGEAGLSASIVTAVTLGIIVDNTVHFLAKYQRARRENNASPDDAIRYAFATVGTALMVTSAILIAGFAILALSTFQINQVLGILTALIVFVAVVTDFLLLPPLLASIDKES